MSHNIDVPQQPEAGSASDRTAPLSFSDLAASRRDWIETVLRPWCRQATLKQLKQADLEWHDFAGRVDSAATLWTWAWERHPVIVHDDLSGVNETHAVRVTLQDGSTVSGYPDGRQSLNGQLILIGDGGESGPHSIDDIASVEVID